MVVYIGLLNEARHEKIDLKVFVVVIPKEGWAHMAATFQEYNL